MHIQFEKPHLSLYPLCDLIGDLTLYSNDDDRKYLLKACHLRMGEKTRNKGGYINCIHHSSKNVINLITNEKIELDYDKNSFELIAEEDYQHITLKMSFSLKDKPESLIIMEGMLDIHQICRIGD